MGPHRIESSVIDSVRRHNHLERNGSEIAESVDIASPLADHL